MRYSVQQEVRPYPNKESSNRVCSQKGLRRAGENDLKYSGIRDTPANEDECQHLSDRVKMNLLCLKGHKNTAISRKFVKNKVHATIPKGNMGYDQYPVSNDCSCRTYFCYFPSALANIYQWPPVRFF